MVLSTHAIERLFIRSGDTVRQAIECVDASGRASIALVIDDGGCLVNTITDGDIRRGILAGATMDSPVRELLAIKANTPHPTPVTAVNGTSSAELLHIMQANSVRQIPLVDDEHRIVDVVILSDLLQQKPLPLKVVIMAGGLGSRLRPLTDETPKPMLPVGDRPLLELTIEQLRQVGICTVSVTTNYLAERIVNHFGDGHAFGVDLNYVHENRPLGTAGSLKMMPQPTDTTLVMNGDIITKVDFRAMLGFHKKNRAVATVGVRSYEFQVPYGVLECEGALVRLLREKPRFTLFINAGIYLIEPGAYQYIPQNERFDMTDLVQRLIAANENVASFPIHEYWLDIGQKSDYEKAQIDAKSQFVPVSR